MAPRHHLQLATDDPITRALAPPPNESPVDRERRLATERVAKHNSDMIDEELERLRIAERKGPRPVKILLLGQSESGKSTTLKNFQLMNSPKAFRAERASWRAVIQLNVVRSVRRILEVLSEAQTLADAASHPPSRSESRASTSNRPTTPGSLYERSAYPRSYPATDHPNASCITIAAPFPGAPTATPSGEYPPSAPVPFVSPATAARLTPEHAHLRQRLAPLIQVEDALAQRLTSSPAAEPALLGAAATSGGPGGRLAPLTNLPPARREVAVNSAQPWKFAFGRPAEDAGRSVESVDVDWEDVGDAGRVLHACGVDMVQLWHDPVMRELLAEKQVRLEEMGGFFLNQIERVTSDKYVPTDEDILRARLKTLGVSEYRFTMPSRHTMSHDWRIYDVGGHRSLRAAWVPFFDDMSGIIFLAPISCFDQTLEEDENVNRIEDSIMLWRAVVSNELLEKTNLVLFLNKCDILQNKLAAGVRFADYVLSYGDRPNDFEAVAKYLKRKFGGLLRDHSREQHRPFYCHFTSVTDQKTTFTILQNVQDILIRHNLKRSHLVD